LVELEILLELGQNGLKLIQAHFTAADSLRLFVVPVRDYDIL
jgi:hypothetical protein